MRTATVHISLILVGLCAAFQPMVADAEALAFLEAHTSQYTQELIDLVKIPSISSLPGTLRRMPATCKCASVSWLRCGRYDDSKPSFGYAEHKDDMLAAAQWLETRLKIAGLEVGAFRSHTHTHTHPYWLSSAAC